MFWEELIYQKLAFCFWSGLRCIQSVEKAEHGINFIIRKKQLQADKGQESGLVGLSGLDGPRRTELSFARVEHRRGTKKTLRT